MKLAHLKTAAFATALAVTFSGCNLIGDGVCSNPSGDVLSETVIVDEFFSIDAVTIGNVFVSEGTTQEIRVEGEQQILDLMDIQVVDGELKIDLNACFQGSFTYNVYVTIPSGRQLEGVQVSGAADLETTTPIEVADNFSMNLFGAGGVIFEGKNSIDQLDLDIKGDAAANITLTSNSMDLDIDDSGEVEFTGETQALNASVSDAGELKGFKLEAGSASLSVSGSANAEVTITGDDLEVDISDAGTVSYKGTPANIQSRISGAGELIDAN